MKTVACPDCGRRVKYRDEHTNKRARCPKCGHFFQLAVSDSQRPCIDNSPSRAVEPNGFASRRRINIKWYHQWLIVAFFFSFCGLSCGLMHLLPTNKAKSPLRAHLDELCQPGIDRLSTVHKLRDQFSNSRNFAECCDAAVAFTGLLDEPELRRAAADGLCFVRKRTATMGEGWVNAIVSHLRADPKSAVALKLARHSEDAYVRAAVCDVLDLRPPAGIKILLQEAGNPGRIPNAPPQALTDGILENGYVVASQREEADVIVEYSLAEVPNTGEYTSDYLCLFFWDAKRYRLLHFDPRFPCKSNQDGQRLSPAWFDKDGMNVYVKSDCIFPVPQDSAGVEVSIVSERICLKEILQSITQKACCHITRRPAEALVTVRLESKTAQLGVYSDGQRAWFHKWRLQVSKNGGGDKEVYSKELDGSDPNVRRQYENFTSGLEKIHAQYDEQKVSDEIAMAIRNAIKQ